MLNPTPIHQPLGTSGSLWPIHLKPIEGEILSSCLSRIASAQGLTLNQFLKMCLPSPVGVGFDIDAITEPRFFDAICAGTGIAQRDLLRTTFLPDQGRIYSGNDLLHAPWIVPLRLKSPTQPGLPFCPGCLTCNSVSYYRKHWRYGFFSVCPEHGLLETHCSRCGHPFSYQGADRAKRISIGTGLSSSCHRCNHRFMPGVSPTTEEVISRVVQLQSDILDAMEVGWIQVPNKGLVHIHNYLHGLRQIASIFHNTVGKQTALWVGQQTGVSLIRDYVKASSALEKQTPQMRAFALFFADWLIQEWPMRFIAMMKSLNLTSAALLPTAVDRPYWMVDPAIEALSKAPIPVCDEEISGAQNYLKKLMGWPISRSEALTFMRTDVLPSIKARRLSPSLKAKLAFKASEEAEKVAFERKQRIVSASQTRHLYQPFRLDPVRKIFEDDRDAGHQYVQDLPLPPYQESGG